MIIQQNDKQSRKTVLMKMINHDNLGKTNLVSRTVRKQYSFSGKMGLTAECCTFCLLFNSNVEQCTYSKEKEVNRKTFQHLFNLVRSQHRLCFKCLQCFSLHKQRILSLNIRIGNTNNTVLCTARHCCAASSFKNSISVL